jgi:hypothetical protein
VIEVLLASGSVDASRLQMPERVRADPYVLPGRRDPEVTQTLEDLGVGDLAAALVEVGEASTALDTAQARAGAVRSPQPASAGYN